MLRPEGQSMTESLVEILLCKTKRVCIVVPPFFDVLTGNCFGSSSEGTYASTVLPKARGKSIVVRNSMGGLRPPTDDVVLDWQFTRTYGHDLRSGKLPTVSHIVLDRTGEAENPLMLAIIAAIESQDAPPRLIEVACQPIPHISNLQLKGRNISTKHTSRIREQGLLGIIRSVITTLSKRQDGDVLILVQGACNSEIRNAIECQCPNRQQRSVPCRDMSPRPWTTGMSDVPPRIVG